MAVPGCPGAFKGRFRVEIVGGKLLGDAVGPFCLN